MSRNGLLTVLAAAAIPFFFSAWIGLESVDQPSRVDPGQTFTATVDGVAHLNGDPIPLESGDAAPSSTIPLPSDTVPLRLGVLVPADWRVNGLKWTVKEGHGLMQPAPDETNVYEVSYPAPTGYVWHAFRGDDRRVSDGDALRFSAQVTAGEKSGLYRVVYMTWSEPPYAVPLPEGSATEATDTSQGMPPRDTWPYPGPSVIETTVAVGEVGPAPQVVAWEPPDGAADVPRDADVRVTFSRDMDLASLRDGGIQLFAGPVWYVEDRPAWRTDSALAPDFVPPPWQPSPVPIQVFYNAATKTAVVDPLETLPGHTACTVMITHEAKATDGVPVDLVRTASFLTERGPEPPFFDDVPPDHRFRTAIETLYRAGIVGGFPDGTFRPDAPVSRAQLTKMLVLLLGIHTPEPDPVPPFSDLPRDAPGDASLDYIAEATRAGITEGFADGTFRPDDTVTRIQLTRMIVRASHGWLSAPPPGYSAGFADVAFADQSYVDWARFNHLVDGKAPGRFDPWSTATRGHASRILYGVYQRMNGVIPVPGNGTSGIEGVVTLGPLHPVERQGERNWRPYEATIVIRSEDGSREVARVRSGPDGRFELSLDPGVYLVDPLPGGDPLPVAPLQYVSVETGAYTDIVIHYDTGIR